MTGEEWVVGIEGGGEVLPTLANKMFSGMLTSMNRFYLVVSDSVSAFINTKTLTSEHMTSVLSTIGCFPKGEREFADALRESKKWVGSKNSQEST